LAAALAWYGWFTFSRSAAWAGGADSSGYLNAARLLSRGTLHVPQRGFGGALPGSLSPLTYVPLGFDPSGSGQMVPLYPLGLPMLFAAGSTVFGWSAGPHLMVWLHLVAAVLLMRCLGRIFGLEEGWAWTGALILAASPLFLFSAIQPMSDVPALVWCLAGIVLAWKSRQRPALALLSGIACSVAVLIRPTDLMLALPLVPALGRSTRRWLALVVGAAPGAIFLGLTNQALFGHVLATGYFDVGGWFGWSFVLPTAGNYLRWLPVALTPAVLLACAAPLALRRRPFGAERLVLLSWAGVFLSFYLFYYFTHETWWYLRFLLPAFPPLIVGSLRVARKLLRLLPSHSRRWAGGLAVLAIPGWGFFWCQQLSVFAVNSDELRYYEVVRWVSDRLSPDTVVIGMQMGGALIYYDRESRVLVRWDASTAADLGRIRSAASAAGRPIFAVLFPFEEKGVFGRTAGWKWRKTETVHDVGIWQLQR
jgi:hypothetical protein